MARKARSSAFIALLAAVAVLVGTVAAAPVASAGIETSRTTFPLNTSLSGVGVDQDDGAVYVEEFASAAKVHRVEGGIVTATLVLPGGPGRLAYDATRNRIYVTQQTEGRVLAIDANTMSLVGSVTVGGTPVGIEVDAGSGKVGVALNQTGQLVVIDGPTMAVLTTVAAGGGAIYLAIAPGGNTIFVSNQSNTVTRHQAPTYAATGSFSAGAPNEMVVDAAGSRLYVGTQNEGVVVVDTGSLARVGTVALGGAALDVTLAGGGSRLVAAMTFQGYLAEIDTATLTVTGVVGNVPTPVFLATNPANDHVFSAGGMSNGALVEIQPTTPPDQLPAVSATDGVVIEGDPGPPDPFCMIFCMTNNNHPQPVVISLDQPSTEWVRVDYAFGDPGTATPGTDYASFTGTTFIAPGETSATVDFTTVGDTAVESDESATFSIVSVLGGVVGTATSTITIVDDDSPPPPTPVVALVGDLRVDEGVGSASIDVYLDSAAASDLTVGWTATAGTATSPADFGALTGSFVIPQGTTVVSFPIAIVNDVLQEPDESFTLALSSVSAGATVDPTSIVVTIADDDTPPAVLRLGPNVTVTEGTGTGATASVQLLLDRPASDQLEVFWATTSGTASSPADFAGGSSSVIIPAGATSATVAIPIVGDSLDEFNEQFTVTATDALGNVVLATRTSAMVTITDDDAAPSVSVADVSANEGDPLTFTLTLSAPSAKTATVKYSTANGTAVASDYTATSGTASFAPGTTTLTVTVPTSEDLVAEPNETVRLLLSGASQLTIARATGFGTIVNDDAPPTVSVSSPAPIAEGNSGSKSLTFTVALSAPSSQAITVVVATRDGTAISTGVRDFTAKSQTFTFAAGQTTKAFSVNITGDRRVEPTESFQVVVQSITGPATGVGSFGAGTILNDD